MSTIGTVRSFQLPPFLPQEMGTLYVPRGITEGLPANVIFHRRGLEK